MADSSHAEKNLRVEWGNYRMQLMIKWVNLAIYM